MISADPKRPYSAGGIDYTYDPDTGVYTGYSAGKAVPHTYVASHYAQYAYYVDATTRMIVLAEFCGQKLIYFEPPGAYPCSAQPDVCCCPCARERNGKKQAHRTSTIAVEIP